MKIHDLIFGICIVATLAVGCKNADPEIEMPSKLIEESTFTDMIAEQLIIEATIFRAPAEYNKKTIAQNSYEQWLKKYDVTPEIFQENVDYYFATQQSAEKVMNEVKDRIKQQQKNAR